MAKSFRFPRWVEKTRTYSIHPVAFIDQPVATPHQPRYAQQLPPGGSQGAVAGAGSIQRSALFHPQMGGCAARVAKLATPTNSEDFGLQQPMYYTPSARGGAKAASPQRAATSLPYGLRSFWLICNQRREVSLYCSVDRKTPPPHVRSAPPLPGEARALRASVQ